MSEIIQTHENQKKNVDSFDRTIGDEQKSVLRTVDIGDT